MTDDEVDYELNVGRKKKRSKRSARNRIYYIRQFSDVDALAYNSVNEFKLKIELNCFYVYLRLMAKKDPI